MAASPVSPQAATEAAVLAMHSEPILSGGIHAREAQTHGTDRQMTPTDRQTAQVAQTDSSALLPLPTATSKSRDFEAVPVIRASTAVDTTVRGFESTIPAPVSIPTPIGMTATVLQAATQEPVHLQPPRVEPTAVERSVLPPSSSFQQADLPVMIPSQAPAILRPVGAFAYTAPAAPTGAFPPSTDRYIPAIGFSPSRARVARDPPADPPLSRIRTQAYTVDPPPAVPQQTPLSSTRGVAATVGVQETSTIPAVSTGTISAAPVDLSRTGAQAIGAVYGPGVTSMPLASGAPLSSHPAVSSTSQGLTQTALPVATIIAGPAPVGAPAGQFGNPTEQLGNPTRQLQATGTPPEAAAVPFGPPPVLATGLQAAPFSPPVASGGPGVVPTGPTLSATAVPQVVGLPATSAQTIAASFAPVPAEPYGGVFVAPAAAYLAYTPGGSTTEVPGALGPGPQGTAPGPLQAGQTMGPGPVAEGTEHSLQASDSDVWSDADSAMEEEPLSQAGLESGPVCEGIETNLDVWSDSASSEPGTPISGSQAVVSASSCCPCMHSLA